MRGEPDLPLEIDRNAPHSSHRIGCPTMEDLNYLLSRWGTVWGRQREVAWQLRATAAERAAAAPEASEASDVRDIEGGAAGVASPLDAKLYGHPLERSIERNLMTDASKLKGCFT